MLSVCGLCLQDHYFFPEWTLTGLLLQQQLTFVTRHPTDFPMVLAMLVCLYLRSAGACPAEPARRAANPLETRDSGRPCLLSVGGVDHII